MCGSRFSQEGQALLPFPPSVDLNLPTSPKRPIRSPGGSITDSLSGEQLGRKQLSKILTFFSAMISLETYPTHIRDAD